METLETLAALLTSLATVVLFFTEAFKKYSEAKAIAPKKTSDTDDNAEASLTIESANRSIASARTRSRLGFVAVFCSVSTLSFLQFGSGSHAALNAGDMATIAVSMQLFIGGIVLLVRD